MIRHQAAPMLRHSHWLKRLLKPNYFVILLLPLTACAQVPPDYSPGYSYVAVASPKRPDRVRYVLAPDACLTPDPTDEQLGLRPPPGCANAANLLAMAERKRDVVDPRRLGAAPAAPAARAAQRYLYGSREALGAGVGRSTYGGGHAGTTMDGGVANASPGITDTSPIIQARSR